MGEHNKAGSRSPGPDMESRALIKAQEKAIRYLKSQGLGEMEKTKITLFLQSMQVGNSIIFPKVEFVYTDWLLYKFFNQQVNKNMEMIKLLTRITTWTSDPFVYYRFWEIVFYFWTKTNLLKHVSLDFREKERDIQFYEFLAFSHALLSEIRITPLILDLPVNEYINLLFEIEEENGRQIQLQVRLLKSFDVPLSLEEKEAIILSERKKVGKVFVRFLGFLCEG